MKMAHRRDAVLNEKFWFRKNVFEKNNIMYDGYVNVDNGMLMLIFIMNIIFCSNNLSNINITYNIQFKDNIGMQQQNVHNYNNSLDNKSISIEDEYEQMSIDNIINGDVGCLFVL